MGLVITDTAPHDKRVKELRLSEEGRIGGNRGDPDRAADQALGERGHIGVDRAAVGDLGGLGVVHDHRLDVVAEADLADYADAFGVTPTAITSAPNSHSASGTTL